MKKKIRCPYFELNDLERAYHDKEWGTPCRNDRKLFEYLMYEVLQCGLSWDTIIQKRAAFRIAFERFDFEKIARYGERDIARILAVPGMIRSRRKIEAHHSRRAVLHRAAPRMRHVREVALGVHGRKDAAQSRQREVRRMDRPRAHGAFGSHRRRAQGTWLQVPRLSDHLCVHAVRGSRQRPRPLLLPLQGTQKNEVNHG